MIPKTIVLNVLDETKSKTGIIEPCALIKPLSDVTSMLHADVKDRAIDSDSVSYAQRFTAKNLLRFLETNRVQNAFYELYDFVNASSEHLSASEQSLLSFLAANLLDKCTKLSKEGV